ncbi:MAG: hypothetical protein DDG60_11410 [Anaerolineae bacterium]|nr:MAG: hypothetical protein DDG60_11410 [Anaerolineae bacterium]
MKNQKFITTHIQAIDLNVLERLTTPRMVAALIIALALLSLLLGIAATSIYGAGVSGDSIFYLSTAENLLSGRGFVDNSGEPFVSFPPLLVLTIAGLSWLFRADVFVVAWVMNLVLLGVNTALSAGWLYRTFSTKPLYFLLGSLFVALSVSNLRMHTAVLSDPLYLALTLLFFFAAERYVQAPTVKSFFALLLLCTLAPLLRFSGLSQALAASLVILYVNRAQWQKGILQSGIFGLLSVLPLGLWIYLHNYRLHNTIWGEVSGTVDVGENLLQGLRKILYWFFPYRPVSPDGLFEPILVLAGLVLVLLILNRKENWLNWLRFFSRPALAVMMLFSAIYYFSTATNIISLHHRDILSDRYYVILMVPTLIVLFSLFDVLILPHMRLAPRVVGLGMLVLFAAWSVYPISRIEKYIRTSQAGEWHNYNVFNNRVYKHSPTIQKAQELLAADPHAVIYSNVPRAAWFYLRRPIQRIPSLRQTPDEPTFPVGWPETPGYLVWFYRNPYDRFEDVDALAPYIRMDLLARAEDGRIYYISAR